jgi:hypothetical protein
MGYNMKGFSGFGNSPAKQKVDLTIKPNPTTKAVPADNSEKLSTYLDSRGTIKADYEMENKGDFREEFHHKDTEISLDKKKKKSNEYSN